MAKCITKEEMDSRLNFGNLCRVFTIVTNKAIWVPGLYGEKGGKRKPNATKGEIVDAICSLILPDENLDMLGNGTTPPTATKLWSHQCDVQSYIRGQALQNDEAVDLIRKNFEKRIFTYLSDDQRHNLLVELQKLILATPDGQIPEALKEHIALCYDKKTSEMCCKAIAECIYWCFVTTNKIECVPTVAALSRKPYDCYSYDPHSFSGQYSRSGAVQMILREDIPGTENILYKGHNFERCTEYILEHNIIIKKIDCSLGTIDMVCVPLGDNPYQLKRVEANDYNQVKHFINLYKDEFRTKISWDEELSKMVHHGLDTEIWTGYAYYTADGFIAAYLDYKIRSDSNIELGTEITIPNYRRKSLATGLINLFRFRFMNSCLFSGTFEENVGMRRVFEKTGFKEHLFCDEDGKETSNRIRERYNPKFPNDTTKLTNSVYYYANSLLTETRLGASLVDSVTKKVKTGSVQISASELCEP